MIDGRECFDPNMVPINMYSRNLSWPPTFIQCDCGEIIGRSQRANSSYYWKCPKCKEVFSMVRGSIQVGN